MNVSDMNDYDREALRAIGAWRTRRPSWLQRAGDFVTWPITKAGELLLDVPGVGEVIRKAVGGVVDLANDMAQFTVRGEAICAEFRKDGYENVKSISDIHSLQLSDVEKVVGHLDTKYKALAATEGAATGFIGLPGIPPDIAALIVLNLRAIGEYATYYGFDVSLQEERLFALHVLGLASSTSDASKNLAMGELVKISQDVARKKTWTELEKHGFVRIVQRIAKALGVRLTKAKLAQVVPASGAVIGAGFNVSFTSKVCDAAFHLYRQRFLAAKYGTEVFEAPPRTDGAADAYPEAEAVVE